MLKANKSKKNVAILALSVMLTIAALFGATAAWFITDASATGNVSTGKLSVSLKVGSETLTGQNKTITAVQNAVAGDTLVGAIAIIPDVDELAGGAYARVKVTTSGDLTLTVANASTWTKDGDYYYYGTGTSKATLTTISANTEIAFSEAITLAENSNDQGKSGAITIVVELVQAKNQGNTVAWTNA
ncbi:MAG: hypothetical protein ACLRFG_03670 [Clostridia bacterium]